MLAVARLLLLVVLLTVPGLALGETCTHPATTHNWTAICTLSAGAFAGCTCDLDDTFVVPSGATVTVTEGSTITQGTGAIGLTVQSGGTLVVQQGGIMKMGASGYTIAAGGTFTGQGKILEYDSDPTDWALSAPSLGESAAYVGIGDIIYCPGDPGGGTLEEDCEGDAAGTAGVAWQVAFCWPDARYDDAGNGDNGQQYFSEWQGAANVGDVLWHYDPMKLGYLSRDVGAPYEIAAVDDAAANVCLTVDVRQGCDNGVAGCPHDPTDVVTAPTDNAPYDLAQRHIAEATLGAAYQKGARAVSVGNDAVAASNDKNARYLSCPGADGTFPGWSAKIVRSTQATPDTLFLDALGVREDVASGVECFIDYGWRRGDAIFVARMAELGSSTVDGVGAREAAHGDTPFICNGSCDMTLTMLDELGAPTTATIDFTSATSLTGDYLWGRDLSHVNATGVRRAITVAGLSDGQVLTGWALTGSDYTNDAMHGFVFTQITQSTIPENVVVQDFFIRHAGDDTIAWLPSGGTYDGALAAMDIVRFRQSFMSGGGGSCGGIVSVSNEDNVVVDIIDMLSEDGGCADGGSTSRTFGEMGTGTTIRNVVGFSDQARLGGVSRNFTNYYGEGRDVMQSGWVQANSGLVDGTVRDLVIKPLASATSVWGDDVASDFKRIIFVDPSFEDTDETSPAFYALLDNTVEDIAVIDPVTSNSGTTSDLFEGSDEGAGVNLVVRRVSFIFTDPTTGSEFDYIYRWNGFNMDSTGDGNGSWNVVTMDGLLVAGFADNADAAALAMSVFLADAKTAQINWPNPICFWGGDDNWAGGASPPAGKTITDRPILFNDRWEPVRGSYHWNQGCGSRNHGARDMWALRVIGLSDDPLVRKPGRGVGPLQVVGY